MRFYGGSTAFYGEANSASFFAGGSLSTQVPDIYDVAIGGRPYLIDLSQPFYRQYHRQVAPLIRTQADTTQEPGEQTMDPNGLWRRSFEDWRDGAGQRYLDRNTSTPTMFYTSQGIDCLTIPWQISLLPTVTSQRTSANTNLQVVTATSAAGTTYTYISDGQSLLFTSNLSGTVTWTTVTSTPAHTLSSLCTDGYTVYAAYGASGIYSTAAGTSSASQYMSSAIGSGAVIGYVNGRLMLGNNADGVNGDGKLYNVIASGVLPSALFAPGNPNAVWVAFAEGNSFLYGAINIGGKGYVYGVGITSDGSSLDAPVVQLALGFGETVSGVFGYQGSLLVGTSLGVRYCQTSASGVTEGSLIPTTAGGVQWTPTTATTAVQCFAAYGRWVWFGWSNYATSTTGLGRIDLENFSTENVQPAFASDLMAPVSGLVTGVANVHGTIVFGVAGAGFYIQSPNLVSSGTISSGYVLYDLIDPKIPALLDLQTVGPLTAGTIEATISVDGATPQGVGVMMPGNASPQTYAISPSAGQRFEIDLTLTSNGTTGGPTLTRWTLRSYPAPFRPLTWQLPLVLDEVIVTQSSSQEPFDPLTELLALESMAALGEPVPYQEGNVSYTVFVQDVEFLPDQLTEDKHFFNGIALVTLEGLPIPGAKTT